MSSRLTAAEIARMQSFLTELLDREIMGTPQSDVRAIQEQFWAAMSTQLSVNPMSTGLTHLDRLARDIMDATPDTALQGTVLALPAPSAVAAPSSAAAAVPVASQAPARSKRKSPAASSKAPAKKPRAAVKPKPKKAAPIKSVAPPSEVESKPPASSTATPLADAMGVSSKAPDVVRQAIEAVLRKAKAQGKSPCRLAFAWSGRPLWYDPIEHPDVQRAHWRFWMMNRRAFWDWAFHAPLEPGSNALANRRKSKLRANQARLKFLSFCIETWGFYSFMEKLDQHPQLFWLGGPPGRASGDATQSQAPSVEDLAWLYEHDRARYEATLQNALDPEHIDSFGYPNIRAFLEATEALFPHVQPQFRLSDTALARIRFDLTSSQKPKDSWAGPKTEDPWRTLIGSSHAQTVQARVVSALIDGTYATPTSKAITKVEDRRSEYSDLEEPDSASDAESTKLDSVVPDDEVESE